MAAAGDRVSSPSSSHAASCPWSHVVRRENDHSSIAAIDPPLSSAIPIAPPLDSLERSVLKSSVNLPLQASEHVGDGNACSARGKKPAWNLPSSSVSAEGGVIMDAEHWPALSDSARASPKSSSDSLKGLSSGSVTGHVGSVSPNSKLASSNANLNPTSKQSPYSIHKPTKRGNTSGATYGGPAVPPPLTSSQMNQPLSEKQTLSETSPKVSPNKYTNNNDNWDRAHKVGAVATQSHGVNDQRSYGGSRRGNNGHHNSYVNRWDSERRGSEWNHRNFVRDVHMLQLHTPWGVQPYPRPPFATQLIAPPPPPPPPPLRPFNNNFGFLDFSPAVYHVPALPNHHPDPVRGVSFSPHPAPAPVMFYPTSDQQRAMLLKQIEYYFSPENLCKDTYLRQNMDEQGWVPISLIAGFNRVKRLTNNIQFIIDTMQPSNVVEVQGDKIRKRNGWMTWILNTSNHLSTTESTSPTSTINGDLAAQLHSFGLEKTSGFTNPIGSADDETVLNRSESGNFSSQAVVRDSEDSNGLLSAHSDWSTSSRSLIRNDTF